MNLKPSHMLMAAAAAFVLFRLVQANAAKDSAIAQLQRRLKRASAVDDGGDDTDA